MILLAFGVPTPFPVSETLLCYFVTALAREGIAMILTYLAAVRHAQVKRGVPEPQESSSLPRLRLVQSGIRRERANAGPASQKRLPLLYIPLSGQGWNLDGEVAPPP